MKEINGRQKGANQLSYAVLPNSGLVINNFLCVYLPFVVAAALGGAERSSLECQPFLASCSEKPEKYMNFKHKQDERKGQFCTQLAILNLMLI